MILHAGLIALRSAGLWRGVLIQGAPGSGKSDLAVRCIDEGFKLVADDRTLVWTSGGRLFGKAPDALFGLLETRGVGVFAEPAEPLAEIVMAAICTDRDHVERTPDLEWTDVEGAKLPSYHLTPLDPSAPAKLRRALIHLGLRG